MAGMDAFIDRLDPDMCVVTATADGDRAGCLVGFASQCSIRPVRYAVWLSKANRTYRVARTADRLAVHLLTREQHALAELFGGETGDRTDKFARVPWRTEAGGAVVLEEAAAWFVGTVLSRTDGGDHVGFVLEPLAWGEREDADGPLLRLSGATSISPGHPVD
ncbi:flavin reductase family protein [Streptomyces sp. SID13726]|uniref:flavin reductase family protein n=1 Tax=Streptomyces sp. SID13726 TaxID=2706058 RepID=UPI0013B73791|nr:flavin reductase family protein [Streptomyces sp. SID13726]NEB03606.1 flavin reductase [Streptomyces sp. SID13726]